MKYIDEIVEFCQAVSKEQITLLAERFCSGQIIHLLGNGGSAAICSHVAVDLTKACGLRAMTYHDPSLITCFTNDYGQDHAFAKIVEKYVSVDDILVLISSSGQSANVVNACKFALNTNIETVILSGFAADNALQEIYRGRYNFHIHSHNYNVVEAMHLLILLQVVESIKEST